MFSYLPNIKREKLSFNNQNNEQIAALLERSAAEPKAYALFAHCFTCSKNIGAATRISHALAEKGFAVLRFDFTGLGNSEGDFANTNFSSNVADLISAANFLAEHHQAPKMLIGHSLGGAAVLAAAPHLADVKAVVTIGAPSDTAHISHLFAADKTQIEEQGFAEVNLAGRKFTIKKQFLDDIQNQSLEASISQMCKALLILHSPVDEIVDISHAGEIYTAAKHPKSFVSLDTADHLLNQPVDANYVAEAIAAWASRYVVEADDTSFPRIEVEQGGVFVEEVGDPYTQNVLTDSHHLLADEPARYGGKGLGPSPYEFLSIALGTCTSMTLRMYANHKGLPLEKVSVRLRHNKIHAQDCEDCETKSGKIDRIDREITLQGNLTENQRQRLLEIADKCPVHKTLHSEVSIKTILAK